MGKTSSANRVAEMRKSGYVGTYAFFIFWKKGDFFGNRKSVFGDGAREQAHAAVRHPLHHLAAG